MIKLTSLIAIAIATLTTAQATRFEDFSLPLGDRPAGQFEIRFREDTFNQEGDFIWTPDPTNPGNIGQILGVLTPQRAFLVIPWKVNGEFKTKFFEVTPGQLGRSQFDSQADAFAAWKLFFKQFVDQPVAAVPDKSNTLALLAGGLVALIGFKKRFPVLKTVRRERLSHARFLKLYKESPGNIARCKIVPPKLGSKDFGSVIVEYDIPVLKSNL
jgi:hypothetical protein